MGFEVLAKRLTLLNAVEVMLINDIVSWNINFMMIENCTCSITSTEIIPL